MQIQAGSSSISQRYGDGYTVFCSLDLFTFAKEIFNGKLHFLSRCQRDAAIHALLDPPHDID